ncbi:unnamed protein product [Heterobilharzia americana]|nr:unnamed protein product [Heterobilharzia americana]
MISATIVKREGSANDSKVRRMEQWKSSTDLQLVFCLPLPNQNLDGKLRQAFPERERQRQDQLRTSYTSASVQVVTIHSTIQGTAG